MTEPEAPTAEQRRAARRANQTTFNLVIALIASLGIVLLLVIVVVRPDTQRPATDYRAAGEAAQSFDARIVVPDLPETWSANRAELATDPADGVVRWEVGFVTPGGEFIALVEGLDANESWVAGQVQNARSDDDILIGGQSWEVYDRRAVPDPGNYAYILVGGDDAVTFVLHGTASDAEFAELAAALTEDR